MKRFLSLGAGVQSSAVLLMSIRGELPKLDAALFADTGYEPPAVYAWLKLLYQMAEDAGIHTETVRWRNIRLDALNNQVPGNKTPGKSTWGSMPFYVLQPDGKKGMVRRQCTERYKIRPLERKIRDLLGIKPRSRGPKEVVAEQWFGISIDEAQRMRTSDKRWKIYHYPLIDAEMTRDDCKDWLRKNGYPDVPRSACVACPFRRNDEWRWLKDNDPNSFEEACSFDEAVRHMSGMRGECFVHDSRKPLREVDLSVNEVGDGGWGNECSGGCGL